MQRIKSVISSRVGSLSAAMVRRTQDPESGVAMLLALFVILSLVTISITVAGVTLSLMKPTQLDRKAAVTENAAEAGFDVALNRIRNAYYGMTANDQGQPVDFGDYQLLPCSRTTNVATFTGYMNSSGANAIQFNVTATYYTLDPTTHPGVAALTCPAGYPISVPGFVSLSSLGSTTDVPGTRTGSSNRALQTVYTLSTTNQNIAGGNIPFLSNLSDCLAVYDSTGKVQVGDQIKVAACNTTAASQQWSYDANLQLQIAGTIGTTLCMQATDSSGTGTNAKGSNVVLATCSANALPPSNPYTPYYQLWSYNDSGEFQNSQTDDSGLGSYCLNPAGGVSIGDLIDLDSCGSSGQFVPTATVGAGAAGSVVRPFQLVNYLNFGRCIDDTNQWQTANWLIGYPCKQDPLATNLTWNQKYYTGISDGLAGSGATAANGGTGTDTVIATSTPPPATGCQISPTIACQFITFPNGANDSDSSLSAAQKTALANPYFCLEAGSTANPTAPINGTIVTVQPCSKTDNYQKWTYTNSLGSNYAGDYLIQPYGAGASNLCLSMTIGSTPPGLTYNGAGGTIIPAYGYISLQTCTGTGWQKWNAPANPQASGMKNTYESPNTGS